MNGGRRGAGADRLPRRARIRGDAGVVIVETALAVPLLLVVAFGALGVGRLVVTELAVNDAARDAALAAARGSDPRQEVARRLPHGGASVRRGGGYVEVEVWARSAALPLVGRLPILHTARASAALEPGA